jgi:glycosyltransferase involved in cell wall biosynthesis
LVVNEVMNAGRAVIVSDQVGCGPDLVKNGENGFIFPAGEISALTAALKKILADPATCRSMGEKSRAIISRWGYEEDLAGLSQALQAVMGRA